MSTRRFNLLLLCCCLFLCCFMYVDSYLIPLKKIIEIVIKTQYFQSGRRRSDKTFEIKTNKDDFDVTKQAYNSIAEGDTIVLYKSVLTNSIQKIEVEEYEYKYMFEVGFIRSRFGMLLVPYLILLIIINIIMNKKLSSSKSQKHLPYIWLIAALVLLAFHLNLDYLFK